MNNFFKISILSLGIIFTLLFGAIVVPAFFEEPNLISAFGAGFVNPYASGYSLDAIFCWMILVVWILYESKTKQIRYGWIAILLGVIPGVAAGFAFYLLVRFKQVD